MIGERDARSRHSDRPCADQGEADRRTVSRRQAPPRAIDRRRMVGLAADFGPSDRTSRGVIRVDTGASAALKRLPRWRPYFRLSVRFDIEPEQEARPQLRAIGIGKPDVKRVVLTHLRIDHDAGLAAFPRAKICRKGAMPRERRNKVGAVISKYLHTTPFHLYEALESLGGA